MTDRLIAELCDFGVVYSLYARRSGTALIPVVKVSWDEERKALPVTRSCVFELDLEQNALRALGRKGNQLPAEHFSAERICAWARGEWAAL